MYNLGFLSKVVLNPLKAVYILIHNRLQELLHNFPYVLRLKSIKESIDGGKYRSLGFRLRPWLCRKWLLDMPSIVKFLIELFLKHLLLLLFDLLQNLILKNYDLGSGGFLPTHIPVNLCLNHTDLRQHLVKETGIPLNNELQLQEQV